MTDSKGWENDALSVQRGDYGTNMLPTALFILGRAAAGPTQYLLATQHPLSRLFNIAPPPTGGTISISALGLNLNLPKLAFLTAAMPGALGLRHVIWSTTMMSERMTLPFAFFGVLADLVYESISTLVFTTASINPMWSERFFYVGTSMYFSGLVIEHVAELQRLAFKRNPRNKGKLCTTGFWGITRHINYTANVLYGFGYGLATGGPVYAMMTTGMYLSNFTFNAIPSIESYCRNKYGKTWVEYEKSVPYKLIPGLY